MQLVPTLDALLALPTRERQALAEALWSSLSADSQAVPMPDWHLAVIDERIAADDLDDGPGDSWADVRQAIEKKR